MGVLIDDILVYRATIQAHNVRLRNILERARSVNLKLNAEKMKLCQIEIPYVGHVLTQQGVKPDPGRLQMIIDMPAPCDKARVQRFLGMVGYVHKFIPNMSEIAKLLRTLLAKDVAWHWQNEQEQSMLKQKLRSPPVLAYYGVTKTIMLQVDTCRSGLGAVLLTHCNGTRSIGSSTIKPCNHRKRDAGHMLWMAEIPRVHIRKRNPNPN